MTTRFSFDLLATDGAARTGVISDAARRDPHAGLHARGHRCDGQGNAARKRARDRGRYPAGQHLSPDAAARGGTGGSVGRVAPVHELGAPDPDRLGRVSGDEPCGTSEADRRGCHVQKPYRRLETHAQPRASAWKSRSFWVRTSSCVSTNARRFPPKRRRWRRACDFPCVGRHRSKAAFGDRPGHALFGIQQGGVTRDLRAESAEALTGIGFDGYAMGGLAVGEGQEAMFGVLDYAPGMLPAGQAALSDGGGQARRHRRRGQARHRHDGLRASLTLGADGAGLHAPWRGQHQERTASGRPAPVGRGLWLPGLPGLFSRAYLHHVFRSQEIISSMLLTWHNLHYYQDLMAEMRGAIAAGTFTAWEEAFHAERAAGDIEPM